MPSVIASVKALGIDVIGMAKEVLQNSIRRAGPDVGCQTDVPECSEEARTGEGLEFRRLSFEKDRVACQPIPICWMERLSESMAIVGKSKCFSRCANSICDWAKRPSRGITTRLWPTTRSCSSVSISYLWNVDMKPIRNHSVNCSDAVLRKWLICRCMTLCSSSCRFSLPNYRHSRCFRANYWTK